VLEHATVIDGIAPEPLSEVTVVVRNGKIESVGRAPANLSGSTKRLDLSGRWLLPGFIDAHVHPFNALESAHNMLASGVTTGRSMLVTYFTDVGLREQHRRGDSDIPDILGWLSYRAKHFGVSTQPRTNVF
jgi:predicted amidohydrolase YtcJ